ncbi:MAG: M28 family peptidase [Roseibacillus sp.]|nr:M28 family peptidase [Roseibacillus sp.]
MGAHQRFHAPPISNSSWGPAAFVLAVVVGLGFFIRESCQPPPVVPADAPAEIFSAERAFQRLVRLLGDESPHPLGSAANEEVRRRILHDLDDLGLDPEVNDHWVSGSNNWSTSLVRARNVMAELPSSNPELPAILLACHYDSVPAGPGASDDGAAVATLLEIAGILMKERPLARPVILLFTDGEELGLHGARGFLRFNPVADRVGMIINFEARGSSGGSLMFETSSKNGWMISQVARGLKRPMSSSAYITVYRMMPNSSDLTVFMRSELAGINFAYIGRPKHYHTPLDNLANLDRRSLQHHGDNALGMVRQLLSSEWTTATSDDDAVYTDIASLFIIAWPARMGPWIAGLLLLAIYLPFHFLRRHNRWNSLQIVRAISCWILCNLIGITSGWLGAWALQKLDPTFTPWPDAMYLDVLVPCLCAGMGVLLTLLFFRPRPALLFLIHGLILTIGGLVLAILLPGFSYLFLLPAAGVALASILLLAHGKESPVALTISSLLVASITTILAVPFLLRLPESLGVSFSPPALSALVALLLLPILPLLTTVRSALVRRTALLLGLCAFAIGSLALQTPAFTADAPQQVTLTYLEQENAEEAQVSLSTWEGQVPDSLAEDLSKLEQPNPLYSVAGTPYQTEKSGLTAPEVELLNWNAEGTLHRAKLRFTSATPHQQILAGILQTQNLKTISALGNDLPISTGTKDGRRWIRFRGVPEDGIEIELTWEGPAILPLVLVGTSLGLPSHLEALAAKRDRLPACSAHMGDQSLVTRKVILESPVF